MNKRLIGILLSVISGCIWAVSGILGQFFFTTFSGSATWLTTTRLLIASCLLLALAAIRDRKRFWHIWLDTSDRKVLIIYSIFGILPVQLAFYLTVQLSNAATATVLQFTGPIFIMLYTSLFLKQKLKPVIVFWTLMTVFGVWLLITNGQLLNLKISLIALITGILSAVAVVVFTVAPANIIKRYDLIAISGWGMLISGLGMSCFFPVWQGHFLVNINSLMIVAFVSMVGTAVAFILSLVAIKYADPLTITLATAAEPVLSTLLSVLCFHKGLHLWELLGIILIISSVLIISVLDLRNKKQVARRQLDKLA